jgi:inner membrane protein
MPDSFSHIVAGLGAGSPIAPSAPTRRYWVCAGICAALPDIDWLWSFNGLPYDHWLAHRGLTHSLVFAAALAALVNWTVMRRAVPRDERWRSWVGLTLATASHGFFDALSTYGLGVAFFLPFTTRRFFFPWRPLSTGAALPKASFALKLLDTFGREFLFIWVPSLLVFFAARRWRSRAGALN